LSSPGQPTTANPDLFGAPPLGTLAEPPELTWDSLAIVARRGMPDAEVLAAMQRAGRIHAELGEQGLRVRFDSEPDRPPVIGLHTAGGELLRSLSPAEALALACGTALP